MKSYKRATYPQKREIEDKLLAVCKLQSDGFYVYDKGWDDERVAKSVADYLSGSVTAGVRRSLKTPMPLRRVVPARPLQTNASINARVTRLERIIDKLALNFGIEAEPSEPPAAAGNGTTMFDEKLEAMLR